MKYYAVIDTKVIVSAYLRWDSVPGNLMDAVFDGRIIPVISREIEAEYREVLSRKKFSFPPETIVPFYVSVPRDLSRVKTKVFFNLTPTS